MKNESAVPQRGKWLRLADEEIGADMKYNYNLVQTIKLGKFKVIKIGFQGITHTFLARRNSVLAGSYKKQEVKP